jgi:molecular chaperone GrpE (heat shock protein)
MLASCEVTVIDDTGPLDPMRHEVVAGRECAADGPVDQIAETVRPGYAWRGELLRPQQVIAYVPSEGGPEGSFR